MAQNRLAGPGQALPYPQNLYPSYLIGAATTPATNLITLGYGEALTIPGGDWMVSGAPMQFLDPVQSQWVFVGGTTSLNEGFTHSDGQNFRVINPQGIITSATVTAAGSGYVQSSTTVTASAGGATFQPVVGGAVALSIVSAGSGYTIAPLVLISAPPSPGLQAIAQAVISSGTVSSISIVSAGAGYTTAPSVAIVPNQFDPNFTNIVGASVTSSITGAGTLTAVFVTWGGTPQASAPTLTVTGAGTSATASAGYVAESGVENVYLQPL